MATSYIWQGRIYSEPLLPEPAKARLQARGIQPDRPLAHTAVAAPAETEEPAVEPPAEIRRDDLTVIKGIGPTRQEELNAWGIFTYEELAHARLDVLVSVMEVKPDLLRGWIAQAAAILAEGAEA